MMNHNDTNLHRYDDIIDLPHHVSPTRPQMDRIERAAQFSPFAALSGYDDAVKETARITEAENELDEQRKEELNEKLLILQEHCSEHPFATVVYYRPDQRKAGGAYVSHSGHIKRFDLMERNLLFDDGVTVPIDAIREIH